MPQRTRKRIDQGLYLVNGRIVYMEVTKDGKLHRRKASVQYSAALNSRGDPTPDLRKAYREFKDAVENETFRELKKARSNAPTPERLAELYKASAAAQYAKHEQPRPDTVTNNVAQFLALAKDLKATRLDDLTPKAVEDWVTARCAPFAGREGADRARVSAWSSVNQAKSLWAKWTVPYYEQALVFLPACLYQWPSPKRAGKAEKYMRPPEELRKATIKWYKGLEEKAPRMWLACTLLLQFGMRPVDAAALRWEDFEERPDGNRTVRYVPSKTRVSSERPRLVRWPVDHKLFERMRAAGGQEHVLPGATPEERYDYFIRSVNPEMRKLGWVRSRWGKACYELRKMCIDKVYRDFGLERAVQISGDNPDTVRDYYSDPNDDAIKPVDLAEI